MLNVDSAGIGTSQIAQQLFIGWRILIGILGQNIQKLLSFGLQMRRTVLVLQSRTQSRNEETRTSVFAEQVFSPVLLPTRSPTGSDSLAFANVGTLFDSRMH